LKFNVYFFEIFENNNILYNVLINKNEIVFI